tara:strand:- start:76 stop:825 length:750 start_codon:yes stop_codon:yes gene_type:complete
MFPYFKKEINYKELYEEEQRENDELKEEADDNKKLFDTTFGEFMKLKEYCKELEEKVDEAIKIQKELKEFKEKAEEECEASAVVEDMMVRIEKAESSEKDWYDKYKNQEPMMDAYKEENKKLIKIVMKDYDLEEWNYDWDERMREFYNKVMSFDTGLDWLEIMSDVGIEYKHYDYIQEEFNHDEEIREQYCRETQGDDEEEIVINDIENCDWDDCEDAFIEWYMNDYCKSENRWWCDYDCGYWYFEKPN